MKKALLLSLAVALVAGVGVFAVQIKPVKSQTAPEIKKVSITVNEYDVQIWWLFDVSATSKLEYGTSPGDYINTYEHPVVGADGSVIFDMQDLIYNTTYYFRIVATSLQGETTNSEEYSFTTQIDPLNLQIAGVTVVDAGTNNVFIAADTNVGSAVSINYGTSSGNLTSSKDEILGTQYPGSIKSHYAFLSDLNPNTTYYFQVKAVRSIISVYNHRESVEDISKEYSFTTSGTPRIISADTTSGRIGTLITINGENFGNMSNNDKMKYSVGIGCNDISLCQADLISWTDSKIVAKINKKTKSGEIIVRKSFDIGTRFGTGTVWTIKGPAFTVTETEADGNDSNAVPASTTANYVNSAFGCSFSTSTQDDSTIKVQSLFTNGSTTDNYLGEIYNLYNDNWGRYPRCSEMQFHLDHSTPIDRLTNWLQEQTIDEKYGCSFSTTLSDESTIRVASGFTLGSDTDEYLGQVYNAYYDNWGRYPRCSEMQFQLDHSTPMARLTKWLEENKPEITTNTNIVVPATSTEITTPKIEFKDSGTVVTVKDETEDLSFKDTEEITFTGKTTPNSVVTLEIASEGPMIVTTKSNDEGYWTYTLPGPLAIGEHTVKVAVADTSGNKISESEAVKFSVVTSKKSTSIVDTLDEAGFATTTWIIIIATAVIFIVLLAMLSKKKSSSQEQK